MLRSALAEVQLPGNNLNEQAESLDQLLKLAETGRAALDDPEWMAKRKTQNDSKTHIVG